MEKKWMRIDRAAVYASVSKRIIRGWLKMGLKCSRVNRKLILINPDDIDSFLRSFTVSEK